MVKPSHRQSSIGAVNHFHFYMQKYLRLFNLFESLSPKGFDAKIFLLRFAQRVFFHKNLQRLKPTLSGIYETKTTDPDGKTHIKKAGFT